MKAAFISVICITALIGLFSVSSLSGRTETLKKPPVISPAPAKITYRFKLGDSFLYKVSGLFTGHFPPFLQPNSPPINLKIDFTYKAAVKKQDDKGAEVAFTVDEAEVSLLEKDPGPDGKIDPDNITPFPLPLAQIQKTLNITARIRPDGSIESIAGGDTSQVKIDIGFDLRKLFLVIMPVIFPDRVLKPNDTWKYDDGLLGHKPGRINYTGKLISSTPQGKNTIYIVEQSGDSNVEDKRDKAGKATINPADVVESTMGTVNLSGSLKFVAFPDLSKTSTGNQLSRLKDGKLTMTALFTHTRTVVDPEKPDDPLEQKIDVKARLHVQAVDVIPVKNTHPKK